MTLQNPIEYFVYHGQSLPTPRYYHYVLAGNGLFKCAFRPYFRAVVPLVRCRVAGLPPWEARTELLVSRIPMRLLNLVRDHACQAAIPRPVEQMYHFHYLGSRWRVSLPRQEVTATQVQYRGGAEASIILDLHSHHNMGAYFSQTDDRDERGCRFYGVIGNIFDRPEVALRVGIWGDYRRIGLTTLFDGGAV